MTGDGVPEPALDDRGRLEQGFAVRREVLGSAHVDAAIGRTDELTESFQSYLTRTAWGEIWSRPGLDRRTRSLLTITALASLGHEKELAMHIRAALANNGVAAADISETLLHLSVYAGVPAANTAFGILQQVVAELAPPPSGG